MVATAIPDIEGNLRAAMLGSALGRKFDHDPQRLADHIGVRVRRVPSTEITHWKGAHVHSSAYYCHHDGEIVISETAQGGWLTWAFSHELGHALALQDWHTSIDEGEHSCDIFARAFLSDIDDSFRQVPGARFRLQFAVTWAEARISEWKAALPGAAPFRLLNLEDSVSVAQYGLRDRVLVVKDILPLGLSVTALTQASATLYGVAVTYLQRHKDPQVAYEVECVGLRHMRPDGRPYFRVGDKLTLDYVGTYTDEDGALREDMRVRQDLYIMAATRTYGAAGESTWKLTVSTIARALPNDSDLIAAMLTEIGVAKIAPLPALVLGEMNQTHLEITDDGIRLKDGSGNVLSSFTTDGVLISLGGVTAGATLSDTGIAITGDRDDPFLTSTNADGTGSQEFGTLADGSNTWLTNRSGSKIRVHDIDKTVTGGFGTSITDLYADGVPVHALFAVACLNAGTGAVIGHIFGSVAAGGTLYAISTVTSASNGSATNPSISLNGSSGLDYTAHASINTRFVGMAVIAYS